MIKYVNKKHKPASLYCEKASIHSREEVEFYLKHSPTLNHFREHHILIMKIGS